MKKQHAQMDAIKLIGITKRTNNKNEMDPTTAVIGQVAGKYFGEDIASKIPARLAPGITYAAYTRYDSDEHGDYDYFIGEAVEHFDDVPEELDTLTIPASDYTKFTTQTGPMPQVVIDAWQAIWQMSEEDFGGKRAYIADFEVYDHRAADPAKTVLDIFIGLSR